MRRKCMKDILDKIYERLDQVENKLTAKCGVIRGIRLIDHENLFVCMELKECGKMGLLFIKLSLMMRKEDGNETSDVPQLMFILT